MHQLWTLIWKSIKVRRRSVSSTLVDVLGPLGVILLYIVCKVFLVNYTVETTDSLKYARDADIIRNNKFNTINGENLHNYLCTEILFQYKPEGNSAQLSKAYAGQRNHRSSQQKDSERSEFKDQVEKHCNVKLIDTNNVKQKLDEIFNYRKYFKSADRRDLSRNKGDPLYDAKNGCFSAENSSNNTNFVLHQAGIELRSFDAKSKHNKSVLDYKLYMTDSLTTNIINIPYELQNLYREYHYPYGSMGSGRAILESCLIGVAYQMRVSNSNSSNSSNIKFPEKILWSIVADPIWADPQQIPILFMVLSVVAFTINGTYILMRVTDDIEMGVYHYLRMSGVSAVVYWSSHFIITIVHLGVQNLIICLLLSIPMNEHLFDPIYELSFGMKYLMLTLLSIIYTLHLMAISLFFTKTTHAVAVYGLIYVSSTFHILLFVASWGPACFTSFIMTTLLLLLPIPVYTNMLIVITGISMKTSESFGWKHAGMVLSYSGQFEYSVIELLLIQVFQAIFWACVIIIRDKQLLSTDKFRPTVISCLCESVFSLSCIWDTGMLPVSDKPPSKLDKVNPDKRVACSLRHVCVDGVHFNFGNLERLNALFREKSQSEVERHTLAAMNYIASHKASSKSKSLEKSKLNNVPRSKGSGKRQTENATNNNTTGITNNMNIVTPAELLSQQKKNGFANVSVDFSFNQITYVIGAVQFKELLFAIILGLRTPDSGEVLIDGRGFPYDIRDKFRRQIGYLGERDMFFSNMSTFENLQFFGSMRDPNYRSYDSESNYVLSLLHLTGRKESSPGALTTRSKRKLSLAVAIVGHTKVLLLVEPTLGLRWKPRCQVLNLLKKYKTIRSILIDTTDIDEAVTCGDKIVLLRNEKIEFDETPQKLKQQLRCGYRIRFSPVKSLQKLNLSGLQQFLQTAFGSDALGSLERWSNTLTEEEAHKQALTNLANKSSKGGKSLDSKTKFNLAKDNLMLCVRPGVNGHKGLKVLMEKFIEYRSNSSISGSNSGIGGMFGFRVTLIEFDSLEDIIVSRIGYQNYPDLPTDLLASMSLDLKESVLRSANTEAKIMLDNNLVDFNSSPMSIIKDRLLGTDSKHIILLSLILPLISVATCFILANMSHSLHDDTKPDPYDATRLYNNRTGFFTHSTSAQISVEPNAISLSKKLAELWPSGADIKKDLGDLGGENDFDQLKDAMNQSKSLLVSSIYMDVISGDSTIFYSSSLPYSIVAALRMFGQFLFTITSGLNLTETKRLNYDEKYESFYRADFEEFQHEWHAVLNGIIIRRYYYGVGFGLSEGLAIGSMALTPGRHLLEVSYIDHYRICLIEITDH